MAVVASAAELHPIRTAEHATVYIELDTIDRSEGKPVVWKAAQVHVDCAIVDLDIIRPDFLDLLRSGQNSTFVLHR